MSQKATIKVDVSYMARCIRDFYARKEMCETCRIQGKDCPYDYDTIACLHGEGSVKC